MNGDSETLEAAVAQAQLDPQLLDPSLRVPAAEAESSTPSAPSELPAAGPSRLPRYRQRCKTCPLINGERQVYRSCEGNCSKKKAAKGAEKRRASRAILPAPESTTSPAIAPISGADGNTHDPEVTQSPSAVQRETPELAHSPSPRPTSSSSKTPPAGKHLLPNPHQQPLDSCLPAAVSSSAPAPTQTQLRLTVSTSPKCVPSQPRKIGSAAGDPAGIGIEPSTKRLGKTRKHNGASGDTPPAKRKKKTGVMKVAGVAEAGAVAVAGDGAGLTAPEVMTAPKASTHAERMAKIANTTYTSGQEALTALAWEGIIERGALISKLNLRRVVLVACTPEEPVDSDPKRIGKEPDIWMARSHTVDRAIADSFARRFTHDIRRQYREGLEVVAGAESEEGPEKKDKRLQARIDDLLDELIFLQSQMSGSGLEAEVEESV